MTAISARSPPTKQRFNMANKKIWWGDTKRPTEEQKAALTDEQVAQYTQKVIDRIIEKGVKATPDADDGEGVISRIVNYGQDDESTAEDAQSYTQDDALRLISGVDMRDYVPTTSPTDLADLLLL